jgi:hypothetical protein
MTRNHGDSAGMELLTFKRNSDLGRFATGVSLHAHTRHSREHIAEFLGQIARMPWLASVFERELRSRLAGVVDLTKGWWHPPVTPVQVWESESAQITGRLRLRALVSMTDHDTIAAHDGLADATSGRTPVSVEWTLPYDTGYFHLGVHNLPAATADDWWQRLADVARHPDEDRVSAALADLHAEPGVLLVFNHPLWDLADVGPEAHRRALRSFLREYRQHVHALELNGYRSSSENLRTCTLSRDVGLPLISGGDRHGCAANALLNVTSARTFDDFSREIRSGQSTILVMPEYESHILGRTLASVADVFSTQPTPTGYVYWTDRIACDDHGATRTLSHYWPGGGPLRVRSLSGALRLATRPPLLDCLCAALSIADASARQRIQLAWPPRRIESAAWCGADEESRTFTDPTPKPLASSFT